MTKEILDSIISTMDFNDLFELAESHLCGLYVIKNKDRDLLRKEYGLKDDLEDESDVGDIFVVFDLLKDFIVIFIMLWYILN